MSKKKHKGEKKNADPSKAVLDRVIDKMEKHAALINQAEKAASIQAAAEAAVALNQNYIDIVQAADPLIPAIESYQNIADSLTSAADTQVYSVSSVANTMVPEYTLDSLSSKLEAGIAAVNAYQDRYMFTSEVLDVLSTASMTPELSVLQTNLINNIQMAEINLPAIADYVDDLTYRWQSALDNINIVERCMAAQNFAVLRTFPDYSKLDLPRGSKKVLKSLTKRAARKLTQTENVLFDPKEKAFCHKDSPDQKLTADQITVIESSQDLFADISLDELISFESELGRSSYFAIIHPVGEKIFNIIKGWNKFIDFEDITYYHARKIEKGKQPYLDQEMMKAPLNVSSHGRYNEIGKSCYYVAETKEGAINEIKKHSGGSEITVQVAGLKAVNPAKIIDLSGEAAGNRFIEHLRFTVENKPGKIVKEYLLPNFVASCCQKIGIEGIKYKSGEYNCWVLWKDDYFEFEEGSRDIITL